MRLVDITGPLENGMWRYPDPYPEVRLEEIPVPEWIPYPTYSWVFTLGSQSGTYLETAAHMFRGAMSIDQVPLERLVLDTAVIQLREVGPNEAITADELVGADMPRFDSWRTPQLFFAEFFQRDILLLAPLVNLRAITKPRVRLIALPLKVVGACGSPCRAIVIEE